MKKFNEMTAKEQAHIEELMLNWLRTYTNECIKRVINRIDEIINNQIVIQMLEELYKEARKNDEWFNRRLKSALFNINSIDDEYHPRWNDATSYREVLYNLFIKK